jgi:hypothetical protein
VATDQQARLYRVWLFEGTRQALGGHEQVLMLDLTTGPRFQEAAARLDALLIHLCGEDGATDERVRRYHIELQELGGTDRFRWPAGRAVHDDEPPVRVPAYAAR